MPQSTWKNFRTATVVDGETILTGRMWNRSFFHLFGVRDSLLQEMNQVAGCGLEERKVSIKGLVDMAQQGWRIPGLQELRALENDKNSWLWLARTMRHKAAHRRGNPLIFFVGGGQSGQVHFRHPKTGTELNLNMLHSLRTFLVEMTNLVTRLRGLWSRPRGTGDPL
jgi:hypothetical protein